MRTDTGTLSIPDLVNSGTFATQATASLKPTFSTDGNGADTMITDGTDDYVRWPKAGTVLDQTKTGFSFHFRLLSTPGGTNTIFATRPDNRYLTLFCTSTNFSVQVLGDMPATSVQTCTVSSALGSAWHHIYVGYDGDQSTDTDRIQVWLDGVQQSFSCINAGGGDFVPSMIRNATDSDWGSRNGVAGVHCEFGNNILAHAGDFLSSSQIGNLNNFERPV